MEYLQIGLAILLLLGIGLGFPIFLIYNAEDSTFPAACYFVATCIFAAELYAVAHAFEPAPWVAYVKGSLVAVYLIFWAYLMGGGE